MRSPHTVRHARRHAWVNLALMACCALMLPSRLHALAMGPGLFMVQEVQPGQEVDLHKLGGMQFTIENDSDQDQDFNLSCRRPSQSGLTEWEKGYEEIPDAGWCRLEESSFSVAAHQTRKVGLIIAIPDEPGNYNRKFLLAVVLKSGKDPAFGVGLAIAARVQIETAVNDRLASSVGGMLATVPGTIEVSGQPGAAVAGMVLLRNNTAGRFDVQVERLSEVYANPAKHARYLTNGFRLTEGGPWLAPRAKACELAPGAVGLLEFSGVIPASAIPGQRYEELAFVHAKTAEGKDVLALVRVHCQVAIAAQPQAQPVGGTPAP